MGLRQTGIVAGATLKALNVPASVRALELAASARRLADLTFPFGERYVVVNLPATAVEAVENGAVVHRYAAIVGDVDHPSPQIAAHVAAINLNPTWTVPVSIIKKEIIPRMQRDPGYLAREKIRILDASGAEVDPKRIDWSTERAVNYTLRQDSGAGNSLGAIRIDMPNKLAVYMHDTPSKRLFGADYRFLSHGCVRVQGVYDLAAWLLEGTSGGAGRRLGQGFAARRDQERRARGHQADALDAGDLGLSDRLGEPRRRRQFPQRRLWSRRSGRRVGERRCAARRSPRCAAHFAAMIASRPLQNRVDPYGALVAVNARGALMGNRGGRFHRPDQTLGRRRWASRQWISCLCAFQGRHRSVWGDSYTELFFLDEPTALAAGHRPCFVCRRADAEAFRRAFGRRRRTKRAGDGRRSPPRAARRPSRPPRRTPDRRTARRRDDRARTDGPTPCAARRCCRGASSAMERRSRGPRANAYGC